MVSIYKTSIKTNKEVEELKPKLDKLISIGKWNFDLEDCDNILRIENQHTSTKDVIELLESQNFQCKELI